MGAEGGAKGRGGPVGGARLRLRSAASMGPALGSADARTRALARADVFLGLDTPGLARAALRPVWELHPDDPELVQVMVVVEAFDGRYDEARRILAGARERDPGHAALWDAARRDLDESERLFAGRRQASGGP